MLLDVRFDFWLSARLCHLGLGVLVTMPLGDLQAVIVALPPLPAPYTCLFHTVLATFLEHTSGQHYVAVD